MDRKLLTEALEAVDPARSANALVPIFTNFWFTGKRVMAYNDHIAIGVSMETEFKGAVVPSLLSLLKASAAKDIELTEDEGVLKIKAASSNLKLPIMPPENFLSSFKIPKGDEAHIVGVDSDALIAALEDCLTSVSADTSVPDYQGITLIVKGKELWLFSTTSTCMSVAVLKLRGNAQFKRAILRADFARQIVRFGKGQEVELQINAERDHALAYIEDKTLYGRLILSDSPQPFMEIFGDYVPDGVDASLVPMPTKLELMLDRAVVVSSSGADEVGTIAEVRAHDKEQVKLRFDTKSQHGEVEDFVLLDKGQPEVRLKLPARLVRAGFGRYTHIALTDQAAILADEDMKRVYMVAAMKETRKNKED